MTEQVVENEKSGLVYPYGKPGFTGHIKQRPEDFRVSENLGFSPTGTGEHLFLYIQKNSLTTHQLIEQLAKVVEIQARHIGYSGLKDKHAITQQWISLHLPGCKHRPEIPDTENYQILQSKWHDKKLRVGVHRSNSFSITVRDIKGHSGGLEGVILKIKKHGFANYFGAQRFGAQQDNVEQALRVLNNRHKLKRLSRNKKSLYISALRSELFNRILSQRIQQGIWEKPLDGDAFMLAGTQSVFSDAITTEILRRYDEFDIHSTISLYGTGGDKLSQQALDIENQIIAAFPDIRDTLINSKLKCSLRANRAVARTLNVNFDPARAMMNIDVELDKGVYLTTLLNHFIDIDF